MGNKQDEQVWENMKDFKKKKAQLQFKTSNNTQPDKPKRSSLRLWGGALVVLIIIFAVFSLIGNKPIPAIADIQELSGKDMKQEVIHEYLMKTQGLEEEVGQYINKVSDTNNEKELTAEDLASMKKELVPFKDRAKTQVVYLVPLQNYYDNQINLVEQIIDEMIQEKKGEGFFNNFQIRELKKDYNNYLPMEQEVIIALFEKAGITYEIQEDGSLYYEIEISESK